MMDEQELLDFMREKAYKPMKYQELEKHFGIEDAAEFKQFLKLLNKLEDEGKIIRTPSEHYGVPERMNLVRGRLQSHAKGFGFLIPEEKDHPDVYLHANDLKSAMNGDTILVRVTSRSEHGGRMEGEVFRIVERAVTQIVGTFEDHEAYAFVVPDDKRINRDIFIPQGGYKGAVSGQKVVVKIITYPEGRSAAEGEIIEILGHKNDPGVDILSIIRKHQLPEGFPEDVMAAAEAAPDSITDEEIVQQGRRDLRGEVIVTIDGEDAKDLDDAVHVKRLENGNFLLGVHIADVGYYVSENSALDQEAFRRGCSVYLVDRVIPMLPHRLSNGICSLNPRVDRLTLSCEMEFDAKTLKRVRHDVFTSVIRTVERMTYTNVRKILTATEEEPQTELKERYAGLLDMFGLMEVLANRLRSQRMKRGAIDFDFQESKVIVDENGKAVDIIKRERSIAEQIIEEFMLAANETVAEHFHWLRVPFLYRIHEDPDQEKLLNFIRFAANFGYVVKGKGNTVHPRALQTLLEEIQGTKEATVISTVMLRSMKQAKYDAESLGHFGLAAEFYSHFTSPIRRYPDLVIHRIIREVIEGGGQLTEARHEYLASRMSDIAQHSSERERVAVDAERDTEQLKKCEFMLDKVGEEFEGIISSVTSFGMFIELDNSVEGLIRLSDLTDDYYHFHEQHMILVGERTSKVYRIGDEVKVRVSGVSMTEHTIDFEMVDMKPRSGYKGVVDGGFGGGSRGGKKRGRFGGERGAAGGERGTAGGRKGGAGAAAGGGRGSERGGAGAPDGGGRGKGGSERGGAGASAGGGRGQGRRGRDRGGWQGGAPLEDFGIVEQGNPWRLDAPIRDRGGKKRGRGVDGAGAVEAGGAAGAADGGAAELEFWQERAERPPGADAPRGGGSGPRTDMWGLPIRGSGGAGGEGRGFGGGGNRRNGGSGGAKRKKTSQSGVFTGERQTEAPGAGNGEGGSGKKKRKKKGGGGDGGNTTAAFVRKKRK
ncbi:ribonuclease R [Paenibacillus sp. N4]|uniref:ribonuclease R n=1 Tax=Paenibacillus vietnamensis TaxID=2590547 RepID=UPI001CD0E62F|nr:ribonuclease R [Paenibacillus vietnamensis]MCA0758139.1 ribonuclease R [Paenibacillus vietnamensis]